MDDKEKHGAGATIAHKSPFATLPTPLNKERIDKAILDKFVGPVCMELLQIYDEPWILEEETAKFIQEVDENLVALLLGDFNWRTRSVGAFLAAMKGYTGFQTIIGNHLLKSEVCYAGETYCYVLAFFNNALSVDYLNRYLGYYLTQHQLPYDQTEAMAALIYLDKINNTNEVEKHVNQWNAYTLGGHSYVLKESNDQFEKNMECLKAMKTRLNS
jgi:hypothetical protein